jgi:aquaporin Z
MTAAPRLLDDAYPPSAFIEKPRTLDTYAIEARGTFGLVLTVGVGICSGTSFAALGYRAR